MFTSKNGMNSALLDFIDVDDDESTSTAASKDVRRLEAEEESLKMLKSTLMRAEKFRRELLQKDSILTKMKERLDYLENEQIMTRETRIENEAFSGRIRQLERALTDSYTDQEKLVKQYADQSQLADRLQEEVERLSANLSETQSRSLEYMKELSQTREDFLNQSQALLSDADEKVLREKSQFREREGELKSEVKEMSFQLTKALGDVQLAAQRNATLASKLAEYEKKLLSQEQATAHWKTCHEGVSTKLVEKEAEIGHWKKMYNDLETVVQALSGQISSLQLGHKDELAAVQAKLSSSSAEAMRAQGEVDQMNDAVSKFVNEIEALLKSFSKRLKHPAAVDEDPDIAQLESVSDTDLSVSGEKVSSSSLSASQKSIRRPKAGKLAQLVTTISALLEDAVRLNKERDALRAELGKSSQTVSTASSLLNKLEAKLQVTRTELARADGDVGVAVDYLSKAIGSKPSTVGTVGISNTVASQNSSSLVITNGQQSINADGEALDKSVTEEHHTDLISAPTRKTRAAKLEQLKKFAATAAQQHMHLSSDNALLRKGRFETQGKLEEVTRMLEQESDSFKQAITDVQDTMKTEYELRHREYTDELEGRVRKLLDEKIVIEDDLDDTVQCLEALAEYTITLQIRLEELTTQKQILTRFCGNYQHLQDSLQDLAAACVLHDVKEVSPVSGGGENRSSASHNSTVTRLEYNPLLAAMMNRERSVIDGAVAGRRLRTWRVGVARRGFDGNVIRTYLPSLRVVGIAVAASLRLQRMGQLRRQLLRSGGVADPGRATLRLVLGAPDDETSFSGHLESICPQPLPPQKKGTWCLPPHKLLRNLSNNIIVKMMIESVREALDGLAEPTVDAAEDGYASRIRNPFRTNTPSKSLLETLYAGKRQGVFRRVLGNKPNSSKGARMLWSQLGPWSVDIFGQLPTNRVQETLTSMSQTLVSLRENMDVTVSKLGRQQKYLDEAVQEADKVLRQNVNDVRHADSSYGSPVTDSDALLSVTRSIRSAALVGHQNATSPAIATTTLAEEYSSSTTFDRQSQPPLSSHFPVHYNPYRFQADSGKGDHLRHDGKSQRESDRSVTPTAPGHVGAYHKSTSTRTPPRLSSDMHDLHGPDGVKETVGAVLPSATKSYSDPFQYPREYTSSSLRDVSTFAEISRSAQADGVRSQSMASTSASFRSTTPTYSSTQYLKQPGVSPVTVPTEKLGREGIQLRSTSVNRTRDAELRSTYDSAAHSDRAIVGEYSEAGADMSRDRYLRDEDSLSASFLSRGDNYVSVGARSPQASNTVVDDQTMTSRGDMTNVSEVDLPGDSPSRWSDGPLPFGSAEVISIMNEENAKDQTDPRARWERLFEPDNVARPATLPEQPERFSSTRSTSTTRSAASTVGTFRDPIIPSYTSKARPSSADIIRGQRPPRSRFEPSEQDQQWVSKYSSASASGLSLGYDYTQRSLLRTDSARSSNDTATDKSTVHPPVRFNFGSDTEDSSLASADAGKDDEPTLYSIYTNVGKLTKQVERRILKSNAAFKQSIDADSQGQLPLTLSSSSTAASGGSSLRDEGPRHAPLAMGKGNGDGNGRSTPVSQYKGFSDDWARGHTSKFLSRMRRHAENNSTVSATTSMYPR